MPARGAGVFKNVVHPWAAGKIFCVSWFAHHRDMGIRIVFPNVLKGTIGLDDISQGTMFDDEDVFCCGLRNHRVRTISS